MRIGISGTGSYIPSIAAPNEVFSGHEFLNSDGTPFGYPNQVIIEKFEAITGIKERRYAKEGVNTSDLGFFAAKKAIEDAGVDPETLDYIIFAHNFGDISYGNAQSEMVPSLASRVKQSLGIRNPRCVAYDMLFGCPGWIEGVIQAQAYIRSGMANKCLIIGGETLSRVIDPNDRDSMIYSDGAGACILEANGGSGEILAHSSATYAADEAYYLFSGTSYNKTADDKREYIKMHGRKIYEFAVSHVPAALRECLETSGRDIQDVKKIFIHQANEKMDEAIIKRLYKSYGMQPPEGIMPMNIRELGNSSVATVPTLFDMVRKGELQGHEVNAGDLVLFASVGAGMNINAIVYTI